MTLVGNSSAFPVNGNIAIASTATVTFNQVLAAPYDGILTGMGTVNFNGSGTLADRWRQSLYGNREHLIGDHFAGGWIARKCVPFTIPFGAALSGAGIVGPVHNFGTISPGDGLGTLTIEGNVIFETTASALTIQITPISGSSVLYVTGSATLDGNVNFIPQTGFYGFNRTYTFLTSGGITPLTTFSSSSFSNPFFSGTITYTATDAILNLLVASPFTDFPFTSANRRM